MFSFYLRKWFYKARFGENTKNYFINYINNNKIQFIFNYLNKNDLNPDYLRDKLNPIWKV